MNENLKRWRKEMDSYRIHMNEIRKDAKVFRKFGFCENVKFFLEIDTNVCFETFYGCS